MLDLLAASAQTIVLKSGGGTPWWVPLASAGGGGVAAAGGALAVALYNRRSQAQQAAVEHQRLVDRERLGGDAERVLDYLHLVQQYQEALRDWNPYGDAPIPSEGTDVVRRSLLAIQILGPKALEDAAVKMLGTLLNESRAKLRIRMNRKDDLPTVAENRRRQFAEAATETQVAFADLLVKARMHFQPPTPSEPGSRPPAEAPRTNGMDS